MTIQEMIQDRRSKSENKEEIDFLAKRKAQADIESADFKKLQEDKAAILKDYKELSLHTSFPKKEAEPMDNTRKPVKSFDEILNEKIAVLKGGK